jgi:hypothetical protein
LPANPQSITCRLAVRDMQHCKIMTNLSFLS